jgi:hypothetical protein
MIGRALFGAALRVRLQNETIVFAEADAGSAKKMVSF